MVKLNQNQNFTFIWPKTQQAIKFDPQQAIKFQRFKLYWEFKVTKCLAPKKKTLNRERERERVQILSKKKAAQRASGVEAQPLPPATITHCHSHHNCWTTKNKFHKPRPTMNEKISQTQTHKEQTQTHEAKILHTQTHEEQNWLVDDRQWNPRRTPSNWPTPLPGTWKRVRFRRC